MAKDNYVEVVPWGETALEDMNFQQMLDAGVIDIAEIDDVTLVKQEELVGKPFILFDWDIKDSVEYGGQYAICRVKTAEGTAVFTDGGTGIVEALERYDKKLQEYEMEEPTPLRLYFHFGLRASHYTKEVDGKNIPATTYYFDNRRRP